MTEHAQRAAGTYSAAADHYDRKPLSFWDRYGRETVTRLEFLAGTSVLDLCCGAGGSALPAARAVGPAGRVLGLDVAEPLLDLARSKAASEGLTNVEFRLGDATRSGLPDRRFDAVVCVFGVFFAADMPSFVREMWRLVRPGGVLAITTWGAGLFEPANSAFWNLVGEIEPALYKSFNPWDVITTESALAELFERGGTERPAVRAVAGSQELGRPDEFWDVVLGSGYRATVDALDAGQRELLRARLVAELVARGVTRLRTDVLYGTARRD